MIIFLCSTLVNASLMSNTRRLAQSHGMYYLEIELNNRNRINSTILIIYLNFRVK